MARKKIKRRKGRKPFKLFQTIVVRDGITGEPMIRINPRGLSKEYLRAIYNDFDKKLA